MDTLVESFAETLGLVSGDVMASFSDALTVSVVEDI